MILPLLRPTNILTADRQTIDLNAATALDCLGSPVCHPWHLSNNKGGPHVSQDCVIIRMLALVPLIAGCREIEEQVSIAPDGASVLASKRVLQLVKRR
jgi:hypothetical protein